MKIVCVSNGHGEDIIAVKILQELKKLDEQFQIFALPLVGEGYAYLQAKIPVIGPVKNMPSGGFIYMDNRQLIGDIKGGLISLTLKQFQSLQDFIKDNTDTFLLAVGDIVPLIFAWLTKVNYAFVGTAKSEYYLRDNNGWLIKTSKIERFLGSVYLPWERFLMSNKRCKCVFPRDTLTTKILQKYGINALDFGNPMMDDTIPTYSQYPFNPKESQPLTILLLPGSRFPEVARNWQVILSSISNLINLYSEVLFLVAIAPSLDIQLFLDSLVNLNWKYLDFPPSKIPFSPPNSHFFSYNKTNLILSQNNFSDFLNLSHLAIAMAGTATEQFVGLGKPAFIIPGEGPQFTYNFAEAQSRLLGQSIIMVNSAQELPKKVQALLTNPDLFFAIEKNGKIRMGKAGAAQRIAHHLSKHIL